MHKARGQLARRRLFIACCAILCVAVTFRTARRRDAPHERPPSQVRQLAAPDNATACWTEDGGRYLLSGGVLRCADPPGAPAPRVANSSVLSFRNLSHDGRDWVADDFNAPLVLEATGIMLCWIPKNR